MKSQNSVPETWIENANWVCALRVHEKSIPMRMKLDINFQTVHFNQNDSLSKLK